MGGTPGSITLRSDASPDGTTRTPDHDRSWANPSEMVDRCHDLARIIGLTRVANVTGLDVIGIPVVMVCRPMSRAHVVVQGKGATIAEAEISGIMEAAEGFHAERIDAPLRYATQRDLKAKFPVAPTHMLPRLNVQFFHQDHRTLWIEGRYLADDSPVWVPYECVHLDFSLPHPTGAGCFLNSSTGLACGNTWRQAVKHALCEVIERDADALWHAGDRWFDSEARIDLSSVADPDCAELVGKIQSVGLSVAAWNITSDIGVPCCSVLIYQPHSEAVPLRVPSAGSGADLCPTVALHRALTEAAQSRLTLISGVREDNDRSVYEPMASDRYRRMIERIEATPANARLPNPRGLPIGPEAANDILLQRLRDAGYHRAIAVDLSRSDIGLPVVRVIVPGLEGPHEAPGALPGVRALRARKAASGRG